MTGNEASHIHHPPRRSRNALKRSVREIKRVISKQAPNVDTPEEETYLYAAMAATPLLYLAWRYQGAGLSKDDAVEAAIDRAREMINQVDGKMGEDGLVDAEREGRVYGNDGGDAA